VEGALILQRNTRIVFWGLSSLLIAFSGCAEQPAPEPVPTSVQPTLKESTVQEAPAEVSEKKLSAPSSPKAATSPNREALEGAMWEIRCLLDSNKRSGAQAIYTKYGFRDAAHWASQWQRATVADSDWAERILVSVLNRSCAVLRKK